MPPGEYKNTTRIESSFQQLFVLVFSCTFKGRLAQLLSTRHRCRRSGVRFLDWSSRHRVTNGSSPFRQSCVTRRRRCLAGHLFQDRWKDQGRGFILLPPWPPNCLGQMLTVRDFSQHLVSSSKTIRPNIPRGARCMGHCEMM